MEKSEKWCTQIECPNTYFHTMESNVCIPSGNFSTSFSSFFCIFNLTILLIPKTIFIHNHPFSRDCSREQGSALFPTGNHPSSLPKTSNHNRLWPVITIFKNNEIMQVNCRSRKETTIEHQTLVLQDMFYQFTFPAPQNIALILSTLFFMSLELLPLSFYPV